MNCRTKPAYGIFRIGPKNCISKIPREAIASITPLTGRGKTERTFLKVFISYSTV